MKDKEYILRIFDRISNGEATDEDIREYNQWCQSFQEKGLAVPDMEEVTTEMLAEIRKQIHQDTKIYRLRPWIKTAVAAAVVLLLTVGGYYFINRQNTGKIAQSSGEDIAPGGNKAVLTLANGQTIILDSVHTGQLASQGNSSVMKADSGLLVYQSEKLKAEGIKRRGQAPVAYNTLSIPRGGQYRLILPDGTKVWLNSASSIRCPAAFTGKERRVAITGEVYMEVAEDAAHPFIVATRHSDITVLGTHFNVMAYDNEPAVATTLLEGSVKVSVPGSQEATILRPGQQAIVENTAGDIKVKKVDAAGVAAWIHGLLSLKDCSVQEFMNQLSRWYDVDVEYDGEVPQQRFGGMINRNAKLSDVLAALEAADIHTKMEEKKIVVLSDEK